MSIACAWCNGAGGQCTHCDDGEVAIESCPMDVAADQLRLLDLAAMSKDGAWPADGGLLDQTAWWVEWVRFAWSEQNAMSAGRAER